MDKGVIAVGYPGVGKSTLSSRDKLFVDLESSNFSVNGEKIKDWEQVYSDVAISLALQNRVVWVSSHKIVRDHLLSLPSFGDLKFLAVVPSKSLQTEWIYKLKDRLDNSGLAKDYYAYNRAKDHYLEDISSIVDDFSSNDLPVVELTSMEYDLKGLMLGCIWDHYRWIV